MLSSLTAYIHVHTYMYIHTCTYIICTYIHVLAHCQNWSNGSSRKRRERLKRGERLKRNLGKMTQLAIEPPNDRHPLKPPNSGVDLKMIQITLSNYTMYKNQHLPNGRKNEERKYMYGFGKFIFHCYPVRLHFLCAALMSPRRTKQFCPQIEYISMCF